MNWYHKMKSRNSHKFTSSLKFSEDIYFFKTHYSILLSGIPREIEEVKTFISHSLNSLIFFQKAWHKVDVILNRQWQQWASVVPQRCILLSNVRLCSLVYPGIPFYKITKKTESICGKSNVLWSETSTSAKQVIFFYNFNFYRPQTKLQEGNVFRSVCHSVHRGGMHGWGGACVTRGVCREVIKRMRCVYPNKTSLI